MNWSGSPFTSPNPHQLYRDKENGKLLGLWGNNYIDHGPYSEFGDLLTHRLPEMPARLVPVGRLSGDRGRRAGSGHA